MKRIFFLLAIITMFGKTSFAQPANFNLHCAPHVCSNIDVVLHAVQIGTCGPIIGTTNPITMVPGGNIFMTPPYTGIWAVDPAVTCPGCVWEFIAADVSTTCPGTPSGTPTCPNWDSFTIGMPHCGYVPDDCFDYTTSCGSCVAGDMRHAHFGGAHIHID